MGPVNHSMNWGCERKQFYEFNNTDTTLIDHDISRHATAINPSTSIKKYPELVSLAIMRAYKPTVSERRPVQFLLRDS